MPSGPIARRSSFQRLALYTTTATASLMASAAVHAENSDALDVSSVAISETGAAHGLDLSVGSVNSDVRLPSSYLNTPLTDAGVVTTAAAARTPDFAVDTPQVVVEGPGEGHTLNPGEPGSIFDDAVDVTGVGQFYRADGFVCTGTLINPRTVLFAAHCVNDAGEDGFGAAVGNIPAAFAFQADALDGLRAWFGSDFSSVPEEYVYNIEQILFDPDSLARPEARGFLESDVALAALDTPASDVPTWAMLFSPLAVPDSIDSVSGTGYDVRVVGYGRSGYGESGSFQGTDFRRRAAENVLGALASLNDRNEWLFGPGDYGLPQNLYQTDFDDPNGTNIFDFNLFRDGARDKEGSTAGGDSGGPLILQASMTELVIGVLSGGSRFFAGQPDSSYGTNSLYQPLYLHWDWIVANNPYRYAQTLAGDGNWSDADHWQLALDPNYMIIDQNGDFANGVPDSPGAGLEGTEPKFGQVCDGNFCLDLATGDIVDYDGNILVPGGADTDPEFISNSIGTVIPERLLDLSRSTAERNAAVAAAEDIAALPEATFANGLPGGSGFVPDNVAYSPETADSERVNARYFDVTLANAGTTTLDTDVTIDKFMIAGAEAALDITADGMLTSLVDITQMAGMMNVDGTLASNGDYLLFTGALTGNGTVQTPYFTNMMGIVAPGTMGTIGTLTFEGNVILTSGGVYSVDFDGMGQSDLISVAATEFDDEGNPLNGVASIGGTVLLNPVAGSIPRDGDTFTIFTAEGGYEGTFLTPEISAILRPEFTYGPQSVMLAIEAQSYASVIDPASPVQSAFAALLDRNRSQYDRYADLYGPLDLQNTASIRDALESFAPREQALRGAMGLAAVNVGNRLIRDRLVQLGASNDMGGGLAVVGQPHQVARSSSLDGANVPAAERAYLGEEQTGLAEDYSGFLAGGYLDGEASGMPTATPLGDSHFDGFYIAGGLEKAIENGAIGIALTYIDMDGNTVLPTHTADGDLYQGSLYGVTTIGGLRLDAQINAGVYSTETRRSVAAGTSQFDIVGKDNAFVFSSEAGIGKVLTAGAFDITPRLAFRAARIDFSRIAEEGEGPALAYELPSYDSYQARAGVNLAGRGGFRPFVNANYVHDFADRPALFGANFVGGVGPNVGFALPSSDNDWGEISGGIGYQAGNVGLSVAAETTLWRDDVSYQSYYGSVTFRF